MLKIKNSDDVIELVDILVMNGYSVKTKFVETKEATPCHYAIEWEENRGSKC